MSMTDTKREGAARGLPALSMRRDTLVALGIFLLVVAAVGAYLWLTRDPARMANLLLSSTVGGVLGCGIGILAAPRAREERRPVGEALHLGFAALIGYLVAKVDNVFDALFVKADGRTIEPSVFPHLGVGVSMFFAALILTYVLRARA